MGMIGTPEREFEIEPLQNPVPQKEVEAPTEAPVVTPDKETVPA